MSVLWSYFWPLFALGLVLGAIGGWFAVRRGRKVALAFAAGLAIAGTAIWHGPLGAAAQLEARIDRMAGEALAYYEMPTVRAGLHHGPMTRRLVLAGPADDFQRTEMARLFSQIPGVSSATWDDSRFGVPLIAEGMVASLAGFLVGLLLAYGIELRRRHNAQWKW